MQTWRGAEKESLSSAAVLRTNSRPCKAPSRPARENLRRRQDHPHPVECIEGLRTPDSGTVSVLGLDPAGDRGEPRQGLWSPAPGQPAARAAQGGRGAEAVQVVTAWPADRAIAPQNWSWIYPSDWTLSTGPIPVRIEVSRVSELSGGSVAGPGVRVDLIAT